MESGKYQSHACTQMQFSQLLSQLLLIQFFRQSEMLPVQRLIHNWVQSHWGLEKNQTLAMSMGYPQCPVTMIEFLSSRGGGFKYITPE